MTKPLTERSATLDFVRLAACLLVILRHAASTAAYGPPGTDHFWGILYGSLARPGVPLFVLLSGLLLLPLKVDTTTFLKRRLSRVVFPLLIWAAAYSLAAHLGPGGLTAGWLPDLAKIFLNYPEGGLHLWYLYTLVGLYLFMPVLSPWLSRVGLRGEAGFLALWGVTLFLPYVRILVPQLWGEAWWNEFGSLMYFSGYLGYLVLGHWITRKDRPQTRWEVPLALAAVVFGALSTWLGQEFLARRHEGIPNDAVWNFCSINVVLLSGGLLVLLRRIEIRSPRLKALAGELAAKSFGVFLVHYFVVYPLGALLTQAGVPAPAAIPLNTVLTFGLSYLVVRVLWFLPFRKVLFG